MASLVPIDYTSKDFDGFVESMLDYAALVYPQWTGRSQADIGVALIESFAYMGDILSFYGDRVAGEAFIGTATQRSSVFNHAALLGYTPFGFGASTGTITLQTDPTQVTPVVVPAGTDVMTDQIDQYDAPLIFETLTQVTVPAAGGSITVGVAHGQTRGDLSKTVFAGLSTQATVLVVQIGVSDGSMDQKFVLPEAPVVDGSVQIYVDDVGNASPSAVVEYKSTASLLEASPGDQVFQGSLEDNNTSAVTLGDGLNGAVPAVGAKIFARYRVGGGVKGNIPAKVIKYFVAALPGVVISDTTVMAGGFDSESLDSIRSNAPRAFRTQQRAVTLKDFEDIAIGVAGVSKAKALASNTSTVKIFIAGASGTAPTQAVLDTVGSTLDLKKLLGTTVSVSAASAVFVNIGTVATPVRIGVVPRFTLADVQRAVSSALEGVLSFGQTSLGQRLSVSTLYSAAAAVPGVAYVVIPMVARSTDTQTGVNDIWCREWEYPTIGTVSVAAEASQS